MKSHLDEDMKDHLDMMKKKFSNMKVAYEKERSKNEELGNELDEAQEELEEAKGELEDVREELEESNCEKAEAKGELEDVREELEEVKQELEDEKEQQRDKAAEEITLVKKLCSSFLSQEDDFCDAKDQILVSNLPPQTTEQMMKSIFGHHGLVHAVKLFSDISIAVVEYRNSDSVFKMFQKYNFWGIRLRGSQLKCVRLEY
jgi:chromosome segregation ATPase